MPAEVVRRVAAPQAPVPEREDRGGARRCASDESFGALPLATAACAGPDDGGRGVARYTEGATFLLLKNERSLER